MNSGTENKKIIYVLVIGLLGLMSVLLIVLWFTPTQDLQQTKQVHAADIDRQILK